MLCAANLENYIESVEQFLEFDAQHFVCGHLNKVGTRTEVEQSLEFVRDVVKAANVRSAHYFRLQFLCLCPCKQTEQFKTSFLW